jgi:hypothetical protein
MICSYCKSDIDNDCFHCDQCGKELFVCPTCGKSGKGKNCVEDGSKLFSPKQKSATTASKNIQSDTPAVSQPVSILNQNATPFSNIPPPINTNNSIPVLRIINNNLKIDVELHDGDIIGRASGYHTNIFGQLAQISGQHAQFIFDKNIGWTFKDLGSTNGSKISNSPNWQNVQQLKPNTLNTLSNNCFVLLANVEFQIKIVLQSTSTGAQRL